MVLGLDSRQGGLAALVSGNHLEALAARALAKQRVLASVKPEVLVSLGLVSLVALDLVNLDLVSLDSANRALVH